MRQVMQAPESAAYSIVDARMRNASAPSVPVESTRVSARAGGKAIFAFQNNDGDAYDISIPFDEFVPEGGGPSSPINEAASGSDTVRVLPHDGGALIYTIKPAAHFPFSSAHPTFHYKYTVHYTNVTTGHTKIVDPDLEVGPPPTLTC